MMSRFAWAVRALACVVGIALFSGHGSIRAAEVDSDRFDLEFDHSQAAPELNSKFRPRDGWIGGDGAQSVDLGGNRTLWLFGDTWVGTVKDGRRSKARIVHNSAGIQCGPDAPCRFSVRYDERRKPIDLISPEDGRGWFWFRGGIVVEGRLYVFMSQVDSAVDPLRPDHQPLGEWLAVIENPLDDPLDWCVRQIQVPFAQYTPKKDLTYGSAATVVGDYLYIYGSKDLSRTQTQYCFLTLARVRIDQIEDMSAWRFLRNGRWVRDYTRPDHIADYMSGDLSIAYMPGIQRFLMVYTDCDISNRIVARTAPTPAGPWSDIQTVHTCRDAAGDSKLFCYAGKAHPTLSTDGKLVISYLTSSIDTWQVATDARLYWPTFVTVGIRDLRTPESSGTVAGIASPASNQVAAD